MLLLVFVVEFRVIKNLSTMDSTLGWPKENTFPAGEKTIMAISTPHRVHSSLAFLNRPDLRLEKVTCKWFFTSIFSILIFCRPILGFFAMAIDVRGKQKCFLLGRKKTFVYIGLGA